MELSFLRDLVIVVFGIVGIGATVMSIILLVVLYRKVSPILDYAREAAINLRDASSMVYKNVVEPIARIGGIVSGIRKVAETIFSPTKKRSEKGEQ